MEYYHRSCSIKDTLKNPSNPSDFPQTPCSWAFRLKDWVRECFSRGLESFSRTGVPPILRDLIFLKDIFRLKHFTMHILQPECRRAGRLRNGWKIWKKSKAVRHVDAVMEKTTGQILKSSCSFNENVLFFFLKALFFSEKNRTFKRLVTCGVTRY